MRAINRFLATNSSLFFCPSLRSNEMKWRSFVVWNEFNFFVLFWMPWKSKSMSKITYKFCHSISNILKTSFIVQKVYQWNDYVVFKLFVPKSTSQLSISYLNLRITLKGISLLYWIGFLNFQNIIVLALTRKSQSSSTVNMGYFGPKVLLWPTFEQLVLLPARNQAIAYRSHFKNCHKLLNRTCFTCCF